MFRRSFFCRVKTGADGANDGATAEYVYAHVSGYIRTFPSSQCHPQMGSKKEIKQEDGPPPPSAPDQAIAAFCGVVRPVKNQEQNKKT